MQLVYMPFLVAVRVLALALHEAETLIFAVVLHHRPGDDGEHLVGRTEYGHIVGKLPVPLLRVLNLEGLAEKFKCLFVGKVALIVGRCVLHFFKNLL